MKALAIGETTYKKAIDNNQYVIDKTKYIEVLGIRAHYQILLRPRGFGKSFFLSMLEAYYDIAEKNNFAHYFGETYIEKNVTNDASKYLVLNLDFLNISTDKGSEAIIESFDRIVKEGVNTFIKKYFGIEDLIDSDRTNFILIINKIINGRKAVKMLELTEISKCLKVSVEELLKEDATSLIEPEFEIEHLYQEFKDRDTVDFIVALVNNLSEMDDELKAHGLLK
jgi:hypothetical protein